MYMEEVGRCPKDTGDLALVLEGSENQLWALLLQRSEIVKLVLSRITELCEERPQELIAFEKAAKTRGCSKIAGEVVQAFVPVLRLIDADRDLMNASITLAESGPRSRWLEAVRRESDTRHAARKKFVSAHLKLVISVARAFIMRGVPMADLVQDGNIGLMKAVDRFDPHRGFKFSTYATWWIRHEVSRGVADRGKVVRIPVHVQDSVSKIRRLEHSSQEHLTDEEVAKAVGITVDKATLARQIRSQIFSLDIPVGEPDGMTFLDMVEDGAPTPAQSCEDRDLSRRVRDMMSGLTQVEREILWKRFGFDGEEMTLKEIGDERDLSRERIRQIEAKALQRLLKPARVLVRDP